VQLDLVDRNEWQIRDERIEARRYLHQRHQHTEGDPPTGLGGSNPVRSSGRVELRRAFRRKAPTDRFYN
jgi:hypothetical protein